MKLESKYRIVRDRYAGYEAQVKHWWLPFIWFEISNPASGGSINTFKSIDSAKVFICRYKRGTLSHPVWESDNDKQFCP